MREGGRVGLIGGLLKVMEGDYTVVPLAQDHCGVEGGEGFDVDAVGEGDHP